MICEKYFSKDFKKIIFKKNIIFSFINLCSYNKEYFLCRKYSFILKIYFSSIIEINIMNFLFIKYFLLKINNKAFRKLFIQKIK